MPANIRTAPGPTAFQRALALLVRRRSVSFRQLARDLTADGHPIGDSTLRHWAQGSKRPACIQSFEVLDALERRWGLPKGYFRALLPPSARAIRGLAGGVRASERRRLAWHLPDDFDDRSPTEQAEILDWVRRVMVRGATHYRRYHAEKVRTPFALRFPGLDGRRAATPDGRSAPAGLQAEMADLVRFKTALLAPLGFERLSAWGPATAVQKVQHLGLVFGALVARSDTPVAGLGLAPEGLSLALLTIPSVWDAYLQWRLRRRLFYTRWEADLMKLVAGLTHPQTGWMCQHPRLAERLTPLDGLVSEAEVTAALRDWPGHCERARRYARARAKELDRLARVHNDPFEPILPVLEAESPVGEYRKIAEEILRRRPDRFAPPKLQAEASRAFLMIRMGLHLGFRQRNLRELLVAHEGGVERTEGELTALRRGELRWKPRRGVWEVFAPAVAFKNGHSRFFSGGPFILELADLQGLYAELETYLTVHRKVLLGAAADPGVLFVKTCGSRSHEAAYSHYSFYVAWRAIIARYGVHNPWTGRGAITGLLPHGPHSVRDVLATHVLKQTGSFEQASYAVQDTPETVMAHYGRFLPQQKAAIAARILNEAWS